MKKECFKCKKVKPIEEYYKHKQMADGHLGKCKLCTKKDAKLRYEDPVSIEKIREYERNRFKNPERKKKILLYSQRRKERKPGVARARRIVGSAIRGGRLTRLPCEVCGDEKSQAHHPDYRSPLNVIWLCFKHHREEHGQKVYQTKTL